MGCIRRGLIWVALGAALVPCATGSVMAQSSDRAGVPSNAPLARPMPGDVSTSFAREPGFPLGPLPRDLQEPAPAPEPRSEPRRVREIAIVPGAKPAVAAPVSPALPTNPDLQAKADRPAAAAERRRAAARRTPPVPAAAVEPGGAVVASEVVMPASPPARAVLVRAAPPTVIVAEPPPTMVQPLSPTGSGSWYFYDQPTEKGFPGRR